MKHYEVTQQLVTERVVHVTARNKTDAIEQAKRLGGHVVKKHGRALQDHKLLVAWADEIPAP